MKKYIFSFLLILWMGVIFAFSHQKAVKSSSVSTSLIDHTVVKIYRIFDDDHTVDKEKKIVEDFFVPVRKLAHFTEYFILGILVFYTLQSYGIRKDILWYAILFCFLYAMSDEIHQLFILGRSCEWMDVLLDTVGSSFSIFLFGFSYFQKSTLF